MAKINLPAAMRNLKKNFLLLFSSIAALCLFLLPSLASLLMTVAIFTIVSAVALLDKARLPTFSERFMRVTAVLIAMLIMFLGYDTFKHTWRLSGKVSDLANALHLSTPTLLLIVGLLGCTAGFYAIYVLSCWIITRIKHLFKEKLPEQRKTEIIANLKRNWYFPISAMAFFCLNGGVLTLEYFVGLLIAFFVSLVIASQIPSTFIFAKQNRRGLRAVAMLTALGICWGRQTAFYAHWRISSKVLALESMLPIAIDISGVVSVFGAIIAVFFVYFCVLAFWKEMMRIISENDVFGGVNTAEMIVYGSLIIASLVFMVSSFAQTEIFYTMKYGYDHIYTSDPPDLVKGNVYLSLFHPENDIRQPLFAVFAAPFIGIPYLIGKLSGVSVSVQAMLVNTVQVVMMIAANFILAKMMKLNPIKRICFMLLTSCTYTYLLFTLMMEQYIVAYFWLIFCMYLISKKQRPDRIVLWATGGTLLTSMILLPFMSEKTPFRNFRPWFNDMVKYGLEFVVVMLAFCRFDVIFNLTTRVSFLSQFTGRTLTMMNKICQYTAFIRNCFLAPDAGIYTPPRH